MRQLLIRPGAIGDCILSFPALEYLSNKDTEVWISTPLVPLVQFAHTVCSIASTGLDLLGIGDYPVPDSLIHRLRSFDRIVSWYGANRPEFRDAAQSIHLRWQFHAALPPNDGHLHASDFFLRQAGAPSSLLPRIVRPASVPRGTIVIHPFSGSARKNWPLPYFQKLSRLVSRPVEWLAGPDQSLPTQDGSQAHRFENLGDLANWLAGASLYLGNDSGITHLAAALGIPVVAIFGPTDPRIWAPRGPNVTIVHSEDLATLQPETVLSKIESSKAT